jgi:hypothetical protein
MTQSWLMIYQLKELRSIKPRHEIVQFKAKGDEKGILNDY